MKMYVYLGHYARQQPICIETNLAWAIPYWTARKAGNDKIRWRFA